jgi:hypothetical protein
MKLSEYKVGEKVEVWISNPKLDTKIWVDGEVLDKRIIEPNVGERHNPYTILIIRLKRTFCKAEPEYNFINGTIPVFIGNEFEFYEMENDEGFIYNNEVRLKNT